MKGILSKEPLPPLGEASNAPASIAFTQPYKLHLRKPGKLRQWFINMACRLLGIHRYYELKPLVNPEKYGELDQQFGKHVPVCEEFVINFRKKSDRELIAKYKTMEVNGFGTFLVQHELTKHKVCIVFQWNVKKLGYVFGKYTLTTEEANYFIKY